MTLPNFIVAGVPRGGTTSLSNYLQQHPEVYLSPEKEPRYFLLEGDNQVETKPGPKITIRTMEQYLALFDGVTDEKAIGEATPFYMASDVARKRIKETLPDVRLIFSLRDPVARAYSSYWYNVASGKVDKPIEEALSIDNPNVTSWTYYAHLSEWYKTFDPSQIKVILFEDLRADTLGVCRDIFSFLGIREDFVPDLTVRNKSGVVKNQALAKFYRSVKSSRLNQAFHLRLPLGLRNTFVKMQSKNVEKAPPIPPEIEQSLSAFYRDDTEQLEQLIGRDLSIWKREEEMAPSGA